MDETKTTFFLSDAIRARLKSVGAAHGRTVKQLLEEGAELVLERYENLSDRETLLRDAARARAAMREGFYSAPSMAADADDLIYGVQRAQPRKAPKR